MRTPSLQISKWISHTGSAFRGKTLGRVDVSYMLKKYMLKMLWRNLFKSNIKPLEPQL